MIILITLVALGFLIYPSLSNYINNKLAVSTISTYTEKVNNKNSEEISDLIKKANAYNYALFHGTAPNQLPSDLGIKKGDMLGYVEIPNININSPIYFGTDPSTLKKGVGSLEGTSFPVGGESTHAVLAAHTGLTTQKLFTDIDKLKKGDIFFVHTFKKDMAYKVDQIKVVHPDQIDDLKIIKGKDYVTLLTCYPYGINTERLLVRGERTTLTPQAEKEVKTISENVQVFNHANIKLVLILISLIILLIIIIISFIRLKLKNRKK